MTSETIYRRHAGVKEGTSVHPDHVFLRSDYERHRTFGVRLSHPDASDVGFKAQIFLGLDDPLCPSEEPISLVINPFHVDRFPRIYAITTFFHDSFQNVRAVFDLTSRWAVPGTLEHETLGFRLRSLQAQVQLEGQDQFIPFPFVDRLDRDPALEVSFRDATREAVLKALRGLHPALLEEEGWEHDAEKKPTGWMHPERLKEFLGMV